MDLQPNKTDGIYLPITNTRISASEWNQLVGSCMAFIKEAGLTPDASDNEQFLNAFKAIAAGLGSIGANTNLSNLTATGEARFTTKANTDLGNVSATGKETAIGWLKPDLTSGVSVANNGNPPGLGYVQFKGGRVANNYFFGYINNVGVVQLGSTGTQIGEMSPMFLVDATDTISATNATITFYPAVGAN